MTSIEELLGRKAPTTEAAAPVRASEPPELLEEDTEPDGYRPYLTRSRPQMGFTVIEKDGTLHGFMYHTLRHPKHQRRDGIEFLSFGADGMAVVMQGRGLATLFRALVRHTLIEAREYDGQDKRETIARIDRLQVQDTRTMPGDESGLLT